MNEGLSTIFYNLECEECGAKTDMHYKDPKSDLWRCYQCDRAFKANVYGKDWFRKMATLAPITLFSLMSLLRWRYGGFS